LIGDLGIEQDLWFIHAEIGSGSPFRCPLREIVLVHKFPPQPLHADIRPLSLQLAQSRRFTPGTFRFFFPENIATSDKVLEFVDAVRRNFTPDLAELDGFREDR
jgi:hypothetical protein